MMPVDADRPDGPRRCIVRMGREMLSMVPAETLAKECRYVISATGWWSRLWRSARAAWRCARIASCV